MPLDLWMLILGLVLLGVSLLYVRAIEGLP
jgi:hypothetical protein